MQPNVIPHNLELSEIQLHLVQKLWRLGAGHPGLLQDRVAKMSDACAAEMLAELGDGHGHASALRVS